MRDAMRVLGKPGKTTGLDFNSILGPPKGSKSPHQKIKEKKKSKKPKSLKQRQQEEEEAMEEAKKLHILGENDKKYLFCLFCYFFIFPIGR